MHANALMSQGERGVVQRYDESLGLGVILAEGGLEVPFHCTTISDGSREIEVGSQVYFLVFPGVGGRVEAGLVEKL